MSETGKRWSDAMGFPDAEVWRFPNPKTLVNSLPIDDMEYQAARLAALSGEKACIRTGDAFAERVSTFNASELGEALEQLKSDRDNFQERLESGDKADAFCDGFFLANGFWKARTLLDEALSKKDVIKWMIRLEAYIEVRKEAEKNGTRISASVCAERVSKMPGVTTEEIDKVGYTVYPDGGRVRADSDRQAFTRENLKTLDAAFKQLSERGLL